MPDEFDKLSDLVPLSQAIATGQASAAAPRLVARLYAAAGVPLRARLLACLMRPLGPLAVAGVAAGAFAGFLLRPGTAGTSIDLDGAAARISTAQVLELARFVEQVDPQALQHFAGLVSGSPLGLATFSSAALVLLYRKLQAPPAR